MSQAYNRDNAAKKAARREMKGHLAALENRRNSTDDEVETGLKKLGYNPKTVTVNGLCTRIYDNFYRKQTDIKKRDPTRDCLRSTCFGQACVYLGRITDAETQGYLWSRSGTMVEVNYQPVTLQEIVAYLNKRDSDRKARRATQEANIAAKHERRKMPQEQTSETTITIHNGDLEVEFDSEDAYRSAIHDVIIMHNLRAYTTHGFLLELLTMPDSHPAKLKFFKKI